MHGSHHAQGRARGFSNVAKKYPEGGSGGHDARPTGSVTKVASIWETLLTKFPKIDAAYFHNDDMALAAYEVMKARGPHWH